MLIKLYSTDCKSSCRQTSAEGFHVIVVLCDQSPSIPASQGELRIDDSLYSRLTRAVAALESRPRVVQIVNRGYDTWSY